jgi:hypothetical protein
MKPIMPTWGVIRSVLYDHFSFGAIKGLIGLTGLDMTRLFHLEQRAKGGASKSQLLSGIDAQVGEMTEAELQRFLRTTVEEILRRQPQLEEQLQSYLERLGWRVYEGNLVHLEVLDVLDLPELPEASRSDLVKAATRLRDGDLSGAISAACGAVDTVTAEVYCDESLGNPGNASFQERVVRSLQAKRAFELLESDLAELGWDPNRIKMFRDNLRGALNQSAYVLQTLRSEMGDVHGTKSTLVPVVFDALKWATLLVRALNIGARS